MLVDGGGEGKMSRKPKYMIDGEYAPPLKKKTPTKPPDEYEKILEHTRQLAEDMEKTASQS